MNQWDIWLVYVEEDEEFVSSFLLPILNVTGLRVADGRDAFRPGATIVSEAERLAEDSTYILAVISRASLKNAWVDFFSSLVQFLDPAAIARKLIPLVIDPIPEEELPPRLRRLVRIDFSKADQRWAQLSTLIGSLTGQNVRTKSAQDIAIRATSGRTSGMEDLQAELKRTRSLITGEGADPKFSIYGRLDALERRYDKLAVQMDARLDELNRQIFATGGVLLILIMVVAAVSLFGLLYGVPT